LLLRTLTAGAAVARRSFVGDPATALRTMKPTIATAIAAGTASRGPDSARRAPPVTSG
jgi:hypothetical protein